MKPIVYEEEEKTRKRRKKIPPILPISSCNIPFRKKRSDSM